MINLLLAIALAASTGLLAVLVVQRHRRVRDIRTRDRTTGVANSAVLELDLDAALSRAQRTGSSLALAVVAVDGFSHVNDRLGHRRGDHLLRLIAERLQEEIRDGDVLARLGGDEFAVLLHDAGTTFSATRVAERIVTAMREPFRVELARMSTTVSVGLAFSTVETKTAKDLLRDAELAMRTAKKRGRNRVELFDPEEAVALRDRLQVAAELPRALERQEFVMHFQPEVDLANGGTIGVEGLVRWQHPTRGLLSPATFIGVAEETGHIVELGRWVLHQSCQTIADLNARIDHQLVVGVNVSTRHLTCGTLVEDVTSALEASGLPANRLMVEVTEHALMQDVDEAARTLVALRDLGVAVAIDDFGTGYSSLAYLKHLPVSVLKIDKTFVDGLGSDEDDTIVRAVLGLAEALDLSVVAEGVETEAQHLRLTELGCAEAQGYLFSRPVPIGELAVSLHAQAA